MDNDVKRAMDAGVIRRRNRLILDPTARLIGSFTVYRNGVIQKEAKDLFNADARTFRVLAVQVIGNAYRASAQPVDLQPPPWWGPRYVELIKSFLRAQQSMFQQQTEVRWDVTPGAGKGGATTRTPITPDDKYGRGAPEPTPGAWTEDGDP